MLVHLHVKNLALIEEAEVEFGSGLNILTGETGAGKSILLGSMQLILGGKTSKNMIREGAAFALVELLFQIDEDSKAGEILREMDVYPEDGQILLSRKIMEGRSINKINGETSTVSQMKTAAACLLDIHGQHEHQSLLYQDKQLEILDAYGREKISSVQEKVQLAYNQYKKCVNELNSLDMDEEQRNREAAFLEFEIKEIEKADLKPGEDEELEALFKKLVNSKKIVEALQTAHAMTGYEGSGAGELIGNAIRELSRISQYDPEIESLETMMGEIDGLLNDFNREVSSYLDGLVFDDQTFYETERRLDLINNLKAKYGKQLSDIQEYQKRQQEKLNELKKYEENIQKAKANLKAAESRLEDYSYALSSIRKEYAEQLEGKIIEGLKDLNFNDVRFAISFSRKKIPTFNGFDEIQYEISTNPGETLKPLGQIVSGGELSRIMLAIKTILADKDQIETLIFDEIDTGISGRTAQKVSEKMAVIGRHHQVLCITHLPQIAAMADTHFEIEKHIENNETITQIHALEGDASIRELARLLGGAEITQAVLENAAEMKNLACIHKNSRLK